MSGKYTSGPWEVWSGTDYVGGGADLCIGAGETWLANMDHRNCANREQHLCGGTFEPCRREGDTDICSTSGCRCGGECPEANHISEEQMANARLIAAAPDQNETLRAEAAFLRRHLERLIHVSVEGGGQIVNGFAAAQIPDWEMRQRLDDIETVLAKVESGR